MDGLLLAIIGVIVLALVFDFTNGFHDAANSVATVVATRALPARWAPWFSAVFNFSAFFFVGTAVANTVAKVVKHDAEGVAVVFAALIAAIAWNYLTWYVGMPSSSSHAIIGGLVGAGLAAGGCGHQLGRRPHSGDGHRHLAGGGVHRLVLRMIALARLQRRLRIHEDAKGFKALQLVSAAAVSFGHGANDAQKTMGIIAAALLAGGYITLPPMAACRSAGGSHCSPTAPSPPAPCGVAGRSSRRWACGSPSCGPVPVSPPMSARWPRSSAPPAWAFPFPPPTPRPLRSPAPESPPGRESMFGSC